MGVNISAPKEDVIFRSGTSDGLGAGWDVMQVLYRRMHPRTLDPFVLLSGFVRSLPVALAIPPQSGERVREFGWRVGRGE